MSILMQYSSAVYSCFIRSWLSSSYNMKKAIWNYFHSMIRCCCQSYLAFSPLSATVLPKSPHLWKGNGTQTSQFLFERLKNIWGKLQSLSYHPFFPRGSQYTHCDITRHALHEQSLGTVRILLWFLFGSKLAS